MPKDFEVQEASAALGAMIALSVVSGSHEQVEAFVEGLLILIADVEPRSARWLLYTQVLRQIESQLGYEPAVLPD